MAERTYRGVAWPGGAPHLNVTERTWWKRGVDAALAAALPVIDALRYETECILDHHGHCQAHDHLDTGPCPDGEARTFMEAASRPPTVWRALIGTGDMTDWYWCPDHRPAVAVREVPVSEIHPSVPLQCTHCGKEIR